MYTNEVLNQKIQEYLIKKEAAAALDKEAAEIAKSIIDEIDSRSEAEKKGYEKVITERLTEHTTKEAREKLKDLFPDTIDKYISVSLSRFLNRSACKKAIQ